MFTRDYLMRQIEQLTVALHKVLFHKEHKQYEDAQRVLSEASRHLLGLNLTSLKALSTRDIMELLTYNGLTDKGKAMVLADLLREQGQLHLDQTASYEAYSSRMKALDILLETYELDRIEGHELSSELIPRVQQLLEQLGRQEIPVGLLRKLLIYYEVTGAYGKAEDVLYYLLEDDPDRDRTLDQGLSFYERIRNEEQEKLIEGNFSLQEAEEGIWQFKKLVSGHSV